MQRAPSKKRKHTFKELMRMFYEDKLPLNYLWRNLTSSESNTVWNGVLKNVSKHFPDGQVYSKRQLKVMKEDMYVIPCVDKSKITYHSVAYAKVCCSKCKIHKKSYNIMKLMTADNHTACDCSVCLGALEPGEMFAQLECAHKFHKSCIQTWLLQSQSCPCCRKNFENLVNE